MFNEYVLLHTPPALKEPQSSVEKTVCSSEKMTQAGDGSIWQVSLKLGDFLNILTQHKSFEIKWEIFVIFFSWNIFL